MEAIHIATCLLGNGLDISYTMTDTSYYIITLYTLLHYYVVYMYTLYTFSMHILSMMNVMHSLT